MRDNQSSKAINASVGSLRSETVLALPPSGDDDALLTLELQFGSLVEELQAIQEASAGSVICPDQRPLVQDGLQHAMPTGLDAQTTRIEAILARLYPIEQAIMQTPACTIAGLGVKARHAAHVMSQYWEEPIDQIDWEAQAVRHLIEAVCDVARIALSEQQR
jgi:hypothetical protein